MKRDCASFHASACSRPPDTSSRMFMPGPSFDDDDETAGGLVDKGAPGSKAAPRSLHEISNLLKRTVEDRFGFVKLRGELSGVKRAASGHLYCCLKDEGAVIDGVMGRGAGQA